MLVVCCAVVRAPVWRRAGAAPQLAQHALLLCAEACWLAPNTMPFGTLLHAVLAGAVLPVRRLVWRAGCASPKGRALLIGKAKLEYIGVTLCVSGIVRAVHQSSSKLGDTP